MKPVIIYTDTYDDKNNTLTIDKDKFESIIDQVYQAGLTDGRGNPYYINYPSGVREFNPVIYDTVKPLINDTTITC